jgi:hypothetical protein
LEVNPVTVGVKTGGQAVVFIESSLFESAVGAEKLHTSGK